MLDATERLCLPRESLLWGTGAIVGVGEIPQTSGVRHKDERERRRR